MRMTRKAKYSQMKRLMPERNIETADRTVDAPDCVVRITSRDGGVWKGEIGDNPYHRYWAGWLRREFKRGRALYIGVGDSKGWTVERVVA